MYEYCRTIFTLTTVYYDLLGKPAAIQGNLDVKLLELPTDEALLVAEIKKMLTELGPQDLIANLGEGLSGKEDPKLVATFIDSVHSISAEMIQSSLI